MLFRSYDTEYAMVDREDDLKIGIKSSAITFGKFDVMAVMVCYGLTLLLLVVAGVWLAMGFAYYLSLVIALVISIHHYFLIIAREKARFFKAFLHNNWFGFAVFAGFAIHYLFLEFGIV